MEDSFRISPILGRGDSSFTGSPKCSNGGVGISGESTLCGRTFIGRDGRDLSNSMGDCAALLGFGSEDDVVALDDFFRRRAMSVS